MPRRSSPRRPALFASGAWVGVFALSQILQRYPFEQPLFGDRAYLLYMAQAVSRGEAIYRETSFGYGPLGPLVSGLLIRLGDLGGLSSLVSVRLGAVLLFVLAAILVFDLTRRMGSGLMTAVCAGLISGSLPTMIQLAARNLEPKILVHVFFVASLATSYKRRWLAAGVFAGLAATCWQPAGVFVAASCLLIAFAERERRGDALLRWGAGLVIGGLPALLYLIWSQQLFDFLQQGVLLKISGNAGVGVLRAASEGWFDNVVLRSFPGPWRLLVVAGATGMALDCATALRTGHWERGTLVMLCATAAWLAYSVLVATLELEFQGRPDFLTVYFLVSFWTARLIGSGAERLAARTRRLKTASPIVATIALGFSVLAGLAARDYPRSFTLGDQREKLAALKVQLDHPSVLFINLPGAFAVSDTPSKWPVLRFGPIMEGYIRARLPGGCDHLLADLEGGRYSTIIVRPRSTSPCLERIVARLRSPGEEADVRSFDWQVGALPLSRRERPPGRQERRIGSEPPGGRASRAGSGSPRRGAPGAGSGPPSRRAPPPRRPGSPAPTSPGPTSGCPCSRRARR